jgi:RNA polymerase sigma-70 factor, ECF subfamily
MKSSDPFDAARPRLRGIAYRVSGVLGDADDVVQEVWMRWQAADRSVIDVPDAWLNAVTTRLAIDHLRRRIRDQQHYVGPWLPEPLVSPLGDPESAVELADSLTQAFMMMLELLSPDERAAFLLADVFAEPYRTIAERLDRSEVACRQLASRARRKLAAERVPEASTQAVCESTITRFLTALLAGDEAETLASLHADVRVLSDGGAMRHAARRPVVGPTRVARFMLAIVKRIDPSWSIVPADVGGLPGLVCTRASGDVELVMSFRVVDGAIHDVLSVLNPDKLTSANSPVEADAIV